MLWRPRRGEAADEGVSVAGSVSEVARPVPAARVPIPRQGGAGKGPIDQTVRDRQNAGAHRRSGRELADAVRLTGHGGGGGRSDPGIDEVSVPTTVSPSVSPGEVVETITLARVCETLDRMEVRYLCDGEGGLLAMWERHAVLIAMEGPEDEILVMRARPHATVPPDWADRAYRVVNEWNHSRRFCKAYVGDPTDRGQLPIYAEVQVPLVSGVHEALLRELLECGVSVSLGFVEWLHDEGGLL